MTAYNDETLSEEELQTLRGLLTKLSGRGAELPWPLYRFINEVAATANVDLLVLDPALGVLLAWRDDPAAHAFLSSTSGAATPPRPSRKDRSASMWPIT